MKKIICLLICCLILLLAVISPAMGEERQVIQIVVPVFGGMLGYEKEFNNNIAILFATTIMFDKSNDHGTFQDNYLLGGLRFYDGDTNNRYYKGIYCIDEYHAFESSSDIFYWKKAYTYNFIGVFGYEWRFGEKKTLSLWAESGININFSRGVSFGIKTVYRSGFGFNL